MTAALTTILSVIAQLSASASTAGTVAQMIALLTQLMPLLEKQWDAMYQPVKNIIDILRNTGAATDAQKAQLEQMEKDADARFDAAAAKAEQEDAAADASGTTQK